MSSYPDPLTKPRRDVHNTLVAALLSPLGVMLVMIAVLLVGTEDLLHALKWVDRMDRAVMLSRGIEKATVDLETGVRGYLLTGDVLFLQPYDSSEDELTARCDELTSSLVMPDNQERFRTVRKNLSTWVDYLHEMIALRPRDPVAAMSVAANARGKRQLDVIRGEMTNLIDRVQVLRDTKVHAAENLAKLIPAAVVLLAIVLAFVAAGFSYRQVRRISEDYELAAKEQFNDHLTGLLNRNGFFTFGRQHAFIAARANQRLWLYYLDLDGLKQINDTYGHESGSHAIVDLAHLLIDTFRSSDTVARIGGDEFAVLAMHAKDEDAEIVPQRLRDSLAIYNARKNRLYTLSASIGVIEYDPRLSLERMLHDADLKMYETKRKKKEIV